MIDYLPSKKTTIGQYYAETVFKLYDAIKQKCRGNVIECLVSSQQHGTPVHKSLVAQQAVRDCGFLQLNHPACSPDLAPSNWYLFRNLKSHLHGPCLQTMNRQKLLLKRRLKGRTGNSFSKAQTAYQKSGKNALMSQEIISKNDTVSEIYMAS